MIRIDQPVKKMATLALLLVALAVGGPGLAWAQQITGGLTGIVMDKSSAVVPNAKVVMTNEASGDVRRTTTNQEGYFSISGVFPGSYSVTIEAPGFAIYKIEKVVFTAGDRRTLGEVTLDVSTTGTEVKVSATAEELTPVDSGEKSVVLNQKQLTEVAVVGRSASEFVKILPGMVAISPGVENRPGFNGENIGINGNGDGGKQSAIGNFSANGTRPEALDITADGAHVSDPGCNCANPVNPNPEMISEFKIQQSNFSAEYAKGPVVLNSITKAGGKDFNGSAYLYARHFSMNSNDAINKQSGQGRPENKYFFPGGTIGGPVLIPGTGFNRNRDKLFFFTGFESFRQTIDTGLLRSQVPTEAMRNGDFSNVAYLNALGRITPRAGADINGLYPDRRIPASQIDPGMRSLLRLVPSPNLDPASAAGNGYNWAQVLTINQNMWQSLSRVDYNISDNTKLFVRYNRQNELQPFPIQLWWRNAGAVPLPTPVEGRNRSDSISANFTKVLSPTVTNETVFGYTFVDFPNSYQDYGKMTRSTVGYPYRGIFKQDDKIPGFITWGAPTATMWLTGGFDPVLFATKHLVTLTNNTAKVVGTHTIKFGGYYGNIINKQPGNEPSAGMLQFDTWHGATSGNVLADMVRGVVASYNEQTLQINRNIGWWELSFFAQDNWKVTPRLTLELGIRAQHMRPWTARNGIGIATWVPGAYNATAPADTFPGIRWNKIDSTIPLSGWNTKSLYWAPRLGFAWDLFGRGRTVIRGGFGTFVFHDPQLAAGAMDLPGGVRAISQCCGLNIRELDQVSGAGAAVFDVGSGVVDGGDNRQPTTYSWNFTISHRLPGRMLLETGYVGNKTNNLINQGNLRDINQVPVGAMLADPTGDSNSFRPRRQYQALNLNTHNFYSNYHSWQTTLSKQTGILNYTFAYTWSKALGILGNQWNGLDRDSNYGILGFDRPHVFAASYIVNVPDLVKSGNKFGKGIGNGWQISGIVQASSGVNLQQNGSINFNMAAPVTGTSRNIGGADILGTPAITAMPLLTCDPRANLKDGQYLNAACFAPPIPGAAGGRLGVNGTGVMPTLRGPSFFNTDISVFKNFRMGEAKNIQFRASAYNFPNYANPSFVNGDQNLFLNFDNRGQVTNPRFGYADSKVGRRIIQFGLRFLF